MVIPDPSRRLRLRSPADLLAAVPYLIGFHPSESLVVAGLDGPEVVYASRADLPPAGDADAAQRAAHQLVEIARRQRVENVVAIGYGPPFHVDPAVTELMIAVEVNSLVLLDAFRVTGDRWWSYLCDEQDCCPAEGRPFDVASSEVAAAATVAGLVALPDRKAMESRVEPVAGAEREAMRQATERVERRIRTALESEDLTAARRLLVRRGERLLDTGVRRYAQGDRLGDEEVAWLSLLLLFAEVIETAWHRTVSGSDPAYESLWSDLIRRVEPDLCAPVATLLAYAAWQRGDGALANVATQRALRESPGYEPARLMNALLTSGLPAAAATAAGGGVPRSRRGRGRRRRR